MRCLCLETRRAARSLTAYYEEYLRPTGLTPGQFGLLSLLAGSAALPQVEIASKTGLDQTTLSRNLQLLITNRWIKRSRSATDGRQSLYTLTTAGLKRQQAALPYWNRAQEHMREKMGAQWEAAFALLEQLTAATAA